MPESLTVPHDFNGPRRSGNGGYASGAVATFLDGAVEVSLRAPVPLDKSLEVARSNGAVRVADGETLIAEAQRRPDFELEVPPPVTLADARDASGRYRGLEEGEFARCFVCGRAREDAFGVFAGRVDGREVVASTWTPPAWTAGDDGNVRP